MNLKVEDICSSFPFPLFDDADIVSSSSLCLSLSSLLSISFSGSLRAHCCVSVHDYDYDEMRTTVQQKQQLRCSVASATAAAPFDQTTHHTHTLTQTLAPVFTTLGVQLASSLGDFFLLRKTGPLG